MKYPITAGAITQGELELQGVLFDEIAKRMNEKRQEITARIVRADSMGDPSQAKELRQNLDDVDSEEAGQEAVTSWIVGRRVGATLMVKHIASLMISPEVSAVFGLLATLNDESTFDQLLVKLAAEHIERLPEEARAG